MTLAVARVVFVIHTQIYPPMFRSEGMLYLLVLAVRVELHEPYCLVLP